MSCEKCSKLEIKNSQLKEMLQEEINYRRIILDQRWHYCSHGNKVRRYPGMFCSLCMGRSEPDFDPAEEINRLKRVKNSYFEMIKKFKD